MAQPHGYGRNPQFGIWVDVAETPVVSGRTGSMATPKKRKLQALVDALNSTVVKRAGELDLEATIEARKALISSKRIPRISDAYPEGYGIYLDERGVPAYGKLTPIAFENLYSW